jgi:hypothetical protein
MRMIAAMGLLILAAATAPPTAPSAAAPTACATAENRQFDFWIGEWTVTDQTTGKHAGESHIEKLYGGCVLRENWTSEGFRGGSLNSWWWGDRRWHQTWMDQNGAFRHFVGGISENRMVMTAEQPVRGTPDKTRLIRLTFTPNADGTVRQYSDSSDDAGRTWNLRYDYLYRRMD